MDEESSRADENDLFGDFRGFASIYEPALCKEPREAFSHQGLPQPDLNTPESSSNSQRSIVGKQRLTGRDSRGGSMSVGMDLDPGGLTSSRASVGSALDSLHLEQDTSWPLGINPAVPNRNYESSQAYHSTLNSQSLPSKVNSRPFDRIQPLGESSLSEDQLERRLAGICAPPTVVPVISLPDIPQSVQDGFEYIASNGPSSSNELTATYEPLSGALHLSYAKDGDKQPGAKRRKNSISKQPQPKFCPVCHKKLQRDLTRHMRIHEAVADFACPFPRAYCSHKHGQFNRPYEYKKHLMNSHFIFHDIKASRNALNLVDKLKLEGECQCGFKASSVEEWIEEHIRKKNCPLLKRKPELD